MKKILLVVMTVALFAGCNKGGDTDDGKRPSTFPQLNGTYKNSTTLFITRLSFGDNNILTKSISSWSVKDEEWKSMGGSNYEWKVNGKTLSMRSWDYSYTLELLTLGEWESMSFEFIDSKNFKLNNNLYTKE